MTKNKTKYVDGFVLVVPKKNAAAYKKMAQWGSKVWMRCGALEYVECVGDDIYPSSTVMQTLTFPKLTKVKKDETVWFSYITFKSRAHRDQVNKKVYAEMNKAPAKYKNMKMPFDMKKMAYGGFTVMVHN